MFLCRIETLRIEERHGKDGQGETVRKELMSGIKNLYGTKVIGKTWMPKNVAYVGSFLPNDIILITRNQMRSNGYVKDVMKRYITKQSARFAVIRIEHEDIAIDIGNSGEKEN